MSEKNYLTVQVLFTEYWAFWVICSERFCSKLPIGIILNKHSACLDKSFVWIVFFSTHPCQVYLLLPLLYLISWIVFRICISHPLILTFESWQGLTEAKSPGKKKRSSDASKKGGVVHIATPAKSLLPPEDDYKKGGRGSSLRKIKVCYLVSC